VSNSPDNLNTIWWLSQVPGARGRCSCTVSCQVSERVRDVLVPQVVSPVAASSLTATGQRYEAATGLHSVWGRSGICAANTLHSPVVHFCLPKLLLSPAFDTCCPDVTRTLPLLQVQP
jgi:hypothetical protein